MKQRQQMLDAVERGEVTVTEACRLWGVSRQTFYEWRRRRAAAGDAGLENRSTRPRRSPGQMSWGVESQIVDMRKAHPRWGARRVRAELARLGIRPPARSSVHAALVRNHLVVEAPCEVLADVRFVRRRPNELWQTDAMDATLCGGEVVHVFSVLDDHSRRCGAVQAFATESTEAAIAVYDTSATALGDPESVLSDRGVVFTGRTSGCVNEFERHLWASGVYTLNGRGYHPQTQGKIERYHRTLREWLADHGPLASLEALNVSLVAFQHDYNYQRPHQALEDRTPAEVFAATPCARPDPLEAADRCRRETVRRTGTAGTITYGDWCIGLGRVWAKRDVRVVDLGTTIEIWSADGLIREVKPDYTRRYLGTGNPRGRAKPRNNV